MSISKLRPQILAAMCLIAILGALGCYVGYTMKLAIITAASVAVLVAVVAYDRRYPLCRGEKSDRK
jgi:predicted lysophospholipase L1 biosynthesis ABC-type transport system permease subunit